MQKHVAAMILASVAISINIRATTVVPGTSNPWLAGMTNGATTQGGDVAPDQSPAEVVEVQIIPGNSLSFSASGGVSYDQPPAYPLKGPEGVAGEITPNLAGDENGISGCTAPANALMGVFIGPDLPSLTPPPAALDFSTPESRDYTNIAPELKQVFFIGDGRTSGGVRQKVLVPAGASRLFLGIMDSYGWYNNAGAFTVEVPPLDLLRLSIRVSEVEVCWESASNATYRVEYRSSLTTNNWVSLRECVPTGGMRTCIKDEVLFDQPQRFYRVVLTNCIPTP